MVCKKAWTWLTDLFFRKLGKRRSFILIPKPYEQKRLLVKNSCARDRVSTRAFHYQLRAQSQDGNLGPRFHNSRVAPF